MITLRSPSPSIASYETAVAPDSISEDDGGLPLSRDIRQRTLSRAEERQFTLKRRPWRLHVTSAEILISHAYSGKGTEEDPFIVEWLQDDVENPMNFSQAYKWFLACFVSVATLVISLASSAYASGTPSMERTVHRGETVIIVGLTTYVMGYVFGPLLWGPMSEVLGRRNLFIFTYTFFTLFVAVGAAAQNAQEIIIFRFFAGFFGASPLTNSAGQIADVFNARQRGMAMGIFASAPFLGPALGPIIGGFIEQAGGFRWIQGFCALFSAAIFVFGCAFLPETYAPFLIRERAKWMSKQTRKVYRAPVDAKGVLKLVPLFKTALQRPWIMLFHEPIVFILTVYMAIIYGTLYMLFPAFPYIFQTATPRLASSTQRTRLLGIAVGMILGVLWVIFYDNDRYIRAAERLGGRAPPEERLVPAILGSAALVVGLVWFTATCSPGVHWIVCIMAGVPFAFGMVLVFLATMNYLVDSYVLYAASVLAANSILRSIFGAAFPLFALPMYKNLGPNWASAIPTFLAAACAPFPWLFYRYGAILRRKCKFAAEAERQFEAMMASRAKVEEQEVKTESSALQSTIATEKVGPEKHV